MHKSMRAAAVLALLGCCRGAGAARIRVVSWNVAELRSIDCGSDAMRRVFAALNADDKPGFAVAPHLYVFQEVLSANVAVLQALLDEVSPAGVSYALGTYTNDGEDDWAGAQAMFYRADVLEEIIAEHEDLVTGAGRRADRWKLQVTGGGAALYIYSAHLKALQGEANEQTRLFGATVLRDDADALPPGTPIIFAGDLNFYSNAEPAYLELLSPGAAQAIDPLGSGSWSGPPGALEHTQSPRCISTCDLTGGCLDDRFDFELLTAPLVEGPGLSLIAGSCRALGNDGLHYNLAINAGDNHYYPDDVMRSNILAQSLHDASDHLPVVADFELSGAPGDIDGDGVVGVTDLLALLAAWGPCGECGACPADLDGDCAVGVTDLLALLGNWG